MKRAAVFALVFAAGFAACWLFRNPQTEARQRALEANGIFSKDIKPQRVYREEHKLFLLRPYRIVDHGRTTEFGPQLDKQTAVFWSMNYDGGRVWIHFQEVDD